MSFFVLMKSKPEIITFNPKINSFISVFDVSQAVYINLNFLTLVKFKMI